MDSNDRRQRQTSSTSGYAGQQGLLPNQAQFSAAERYGQPPLTGHTATSTPSSGSRANPQGYGYSYGEGSQFASAMPPSAGVPSAVAGMSYGATDYSSDQQRVSQSYQSYGYGVSSQQGIPPQSPYDPVQQGYPPRQNAAIEVLTNQFGGVAQTSYYGQGGGPTSSPATAIAAQNVPSQYSSLQYTTQQSPVGRETLATAYSAAGMTDSSQPTSSGAYSQARYNGAGADPSVDDSYQTYQTQVKQAFEFIRDGRLQEAGTSIYTVSDFLLNSVEAFARDEEGLHEERIKLWAQFNNCWLSALQREKQMLNNMIESGQRPQPPQTLIEYSYLESLGDALIKLCDQMEKHGLVDYEMGVWEEEIVAMLTSCLELWEKLGASPSSQRAHSATSRRR